VPPTLPTLTLLLAALAVLLIGVLDTALSSEWDLLTVLGLLVVLLLVLISRVRGRRPALGLRADLVRWLRARSALTGEPVEVIADRAVAAYRASYGDERPEGDPGAGPTAGS
jgi:membrane protein implicated in regulation of membrane protease activity